FHEIAGSGNRLMTLINDLLDLAKLESGRMNYVMAEQDLNKIIITMAHEFHPILIQKSQELKVAGPEMTLMTALDIDRISQVLRNLLSNSVKFSDEGSEIVIRAKEETVKLEDREQTFLNVSVTDRGAGIPEQELEDVFDKFIQSTKTQTVSGGTGLGLAISKQIIEDHDGKIWAENNPDGGAIFCFSIPKRSVVNVAD
ncbi:MAG: HAMP domain-containing histidine kinase, partial [Desulfocapsa sp.]|nr:HAMP domain-containing histidine kinase [Desulfocapsa sp.]